MKKATRGGVSRRGQRATKHSEKRHEKKESREKMADNEDDSTQGNNSELLKHLSNICKEIRDLKEEIKRNMTTLESSFKEEFNRFKDDVNGKLQASYVEIREQWEHITEALKSTSWKHLTWMQGR